MGFWENAWNWTKGAVSDIADVATKVAPLVPLFLKKGGKVEMPDTPANRTKFLKHFNKAHKTKLSMKILDEIIASKGKKKLRLSK
jgi:hypothetical protein